MKLCVNDKCRPSKLFEILRFEKERRKTFFILRLAVIIYFNVLSSTTVVDYIKLPTVFV